MYDGYTNITDIMSVLIIFQLLSIDYTVKLLGTPFFK